MVKTAKSQHPVIKIFRRKIGQDYPCFIVAEISANHHQNYAEAVELIKAAKRTGADAVKFQTYTPDTMTIDARTKPFIVTGKNIPKLWRGKNLYDLYKIAYTPWEWFPKLKKIAKKENIIIFSTPFDETAVDFLESLDVPCYKIASYEALDVPLLRKVASTGKPIIISHGFYSLEDVEFSIKTLREAGARQIAVLYCVTQYASMAPIKNINLNTMLDIRKNFKVVCGFSDNNAGIEMPIIAASAGASIIEKHFILDRKSGGPDARFSIEPYEFRSMVNTIRHNDKIMGKVNYGPSGKEAKEIKRYCRSLFVVKTIKKGEALTPENIRSIRPNAGLSPKYWDKIIGKKAASDITAGTPLSWKLIMK